MLCFGDRFTYRSLSRLETERVFQSCYFETFVSRCFCSALNCFLRGWWLFNFTVKSPSLSFWPWLKFSSWDSTLFTLLQEALLLLFCLYLCKLFKLISCKFCQGDAKLICINILNTLYQYFEHPVVEFELAYSGFFNIAK